MSCPDCGESLTHDNPQCNHPAKPVTLAPLTEDQITNWRYFLAYTLGSYALIMPVADIEAYRAKMQLLADELPKD